MSNSRMRKSGVVDEFAGGSGFRAVSSGRMAAKCGLDELQSPSAAEITETRPWRETVRKAL